MAEIPRDAELHNKPVGEVVDDLMKQSEDALKRGAAVTAELHELKRRADDALDWRKQLRKHSGLVAGLAVAAAVLTLVLLSRDSDSD